MSGGETPLRYQWWDALQSEHGPPATRRHVLLALSTYGDPDGSSIYPSHRQLQKATGLSRQTVGNHLEKAEREGWIRRRYVVHSKAAHGYRGHGYELTIPPGVVNEVHQPTEGVVNEVHQPEGGVGQPQTPGWSTSDPGLVKEDDHTSPRTTPRPLEGTPPESTDRGNTTPLNSPSPSPPKSAARPKRQEHPLPEDWAPNETHRAKAEKLEVNVDHEAEKFRTYAQSNDRRLRDWDAGFHNWLLKAVEIAGTAAGGGRRNGARARSQPAGDDLDAWDHDLGMTRREALERFRQRAAQREAEGRGQLAQALMEGPDALLQHTDALPRGFTRPDAQDLTACVTDEPGSYVAELVAETLHGMAGTPWDPTSFARALAKRARRNGRGEAEAKRLAQQLASGRKTPHTPQEET